MYGAARQGAKKKNEAERGEVLPNEWLGKNKQRPGKNRKNNEG